MTSSASSAARPADRCVVLVPVFAHIEPPCEAGLRELEARGYVVRRIYGRSQIDYARSVMATAALNDGFEELLWIDADIAFEADFVERLRQHRLPVVSGVYVKKGARALACEFLPETREFVFGPGGGLLPIRYAPAGFLLTERRVYDAIREQCELPLCNAGPTRQPAFHPYFQPMTVPDGESEFYLGEDFAFCERARQCGFEIVADTSRRLYHMGTYAYSWEDAGTGTKRHDTYTYRLIDSDERN